MNAVFSQLWTVDNKEPEIIFPLFSDYGKFPKNVKKDFRPHLIHPILFSFL